MRKLTWTSFTFILVILLTSPPLTTAQIRHDRRVTGAQISKAVSRWFKPDPENSRGLSPSEQQDAVLRSIRECARGRSCGRVRQSLVTKEILLRLQTHDLDQDCTNSDGNYTFALYSGDYRSGRDEPTAPYQAWQDELLDTGLTFCNPFKHLYCSPISKKCECRPGTAWKTDVNEDACSASLGGTCWLPGVVSPDPSPRLYNPIDRSDDDIKIRETICSGEKEMDGKKSTACTPGLKLFLNNLCANDEIRELDKKFEEHFEGLPALSFGDPCNFDHQTQLFTTTEEELKNYTIRVKKLEAIRDVKTTFCNHSEFLVCGSGGKCECMKPSTYNPDTKLCTFKDPREPCQEEIKFKKMTPNYPGKVSEEILKGFEAARARVCKFGCDDVTFADGKLVEPPAKFCRTCIRAPRPLHLFGEDCDQNLTLFLEGYAPPSLPIDIPDYDKQLELFVQFNDKAKEFEKLFRLDENSTCDYEAEIEVYRSIRRILNVELPDRIFTEKDYKDLMSSLDTLVGKYGDNGLCRYRLTPRDQFASGLVTRHKPILLCGPTRNNPMCYRPNNTFYIDILVKRLSEKSIQTTSSNKTCSPPPKDVLQYALDNVGRSDFAAKNDPWPFNDYAFAYLFITLENLWIEDSELCNRTAGFKCSKSLFDKTNGAGTCKFSRDLLDDVLAEFEQAETNRLAALNLTASKSSFHLIQSLMPTLTLLHTIIIITVNQF